MRTPTHLPHIVIAGGGVAAVEAALALHDLAGERIRLTIVAPEREFALRPLSTAEPFSRDHVRRHSLTALAEEVSAELVTGAIAEVHPDRHAVGLVGGREIGYDALVVAVGGRQRTALRRALTFTGDRSSMSYNELLADVDGGWARAIEFIVPPGTAWTLPLYELALMTAAEAWDMGIDDMRIRIVSPEAAPLALFGPQASAAVAALLQRANIAFRGGTYAREGEDRRIELVPGGERLDRERIVTLPTMDGPGIAGLPTDERAFIPTDEHGRVRGVDDVYAAGDGTAFPVKQGGIACQQADAIAELLAAAAGAPVTPQPFRPVLRGRLLTGRGAQYLEHAIHGGAGEGPEPELRLWDVAHKVEGRYLSPWLAQREGGAPPPQRLEGDVDVDVALPTAYEAGRAAMRLAPYSPTGRWPAAQPTLD